MCQNEKNILEPRILTCCEVDGDSEYEDNAKAFGKSETRSLIYGHGPNIGSGFARYWNNLLKLI